MMNIKNTLCTLVLMGMCVGGTVAFALTGKYKEVDKLQKSSVSTQVIIIKNPNHLAIHQPQRPVKYQTWQSSPPQYTWYSPHNAFRVAKRPDQPALPANWSQQLQRGSRLSEHLYRRGKVVYRSPAGLVRIRIGNVTIQLDEPSRTIHSVIQP